MKDRQIAFRVSEEMFEKLAKKADEEGRTISNLLRYIVNDYLSK